MEDSFDDGFALNILGLVVDADIVSHAKSAIRDFNFVEILLGFYDGLAVAWTCKGKQCPTVESGFG